MNKVGKLKKLTGNLLGIVEIVAVIDIFSLSWIQIVLELSEVLLSKFSLAFRGKPLLHRVVESFFMLAIDGCAGGPCK